MARKTSLTSVDDLLDEIDDLLATPTKTPSQTPSVTPAAPDDDIDRLLSGLGGGGGSKCGDEPRGSAIRAAAPAVPAPPARARSPVVTSTPLRFPSSSSVGGGAEAEEESQYRCSKCDFKVISFADREWDETVDYMFFRNFVPNRAKLAAKLVASEGMSALCCQCSWCNMAAWGGRVPHSFWFRS